MARNRRFAFDPRAESADANPRRCDHPGCEEAGLHRAPRSRDSLRAYYWFCLAHVRDYNASWDFFAGMSQAEIEAFRDADVIGHRPTWPLGVGQPWRRALDADELADLFGVLGARSRRPAHNGHDLHDSRERAALEALDLAAGAELDDVKRRFKALVKALHPDLNGGDRSREARLRLVIEAYRFLVARHAS